MRRLKGWQTSRVGDDAADSRKGLHVHGEAVGGIDLGDEVAVGEGGLIAEREPAAVFGDEGFKGGEACADPAADPGLNLLI